MNKILIIGSQGMAGHVIKRYLKEKNLFEIFDIARSNKYGDVTFELDVTNFQELEDILNSTKPNFIINCIGILNLEAETNPDKAILINSYFPHFLAKLATKLGAKLFHISSDCVFNGKKGNYKEDDFKDGFGFYAQSKSLGEVTYGGHLTIRTSIIGPEIKNDGIGLLDWFLKQSGEINGYINVFWSGVTTLQLAKSIFILLENNKNGLIHLTNNNKISKYELLIHFKNEFIKNSTIIVPDEKIILDKSVINTRTDVNLNIPSYIEMIHDMKNYIYTDKSNYNINYF
jgi:dTDP-4-dehydrorhamnose reductase